ncbi:MAG: glycine cleavage system protein GcvH [Granulosicoccaceae bacterium]
MSIKYTADHEWVKLEADDVVLVGITDHAQEQLGDVVFVELPEIDAAFGQGDDISVIESVKAASELKAPVSGSIVAVNEALSDEPNIVNDDPMDAGWFCRIKLSDPSELDALLDEDGYKATLA